MQKQQLIACNASNTLYNPTYNRIASSTLAHAETRLTGRALSRCIMMSVATTLVGSTIGSGVFRRQGQHIRTPLLHPCSKHRM